MQHKLEITERRTVIKDYLADRGWICVMRGTRR